MSTLRRGLTALVLALWSATAAPTQSGPEHTVERLHAALVAIMRDGPTLGFQGRLDTIQPEVEATFGFESVARAVLGRHWDALGAPERRSMQDLLARLTAVNYARNFTRLDRERFTLREVEPARAGRQVVRTELRNADELKAGFDYVLEANDEGWRIVNVLVDGVSDLSVKRAEYASILRSEGFPALAGRIERQITELVEDAASSG